MMLKIAAAGGLLIVVLGWLCITLYGQLKDERTARLETEKRLTDTLAAVETADRETAKLNARISELRKKATAKEDRINATISKEGADPCLTRRVDPAIINQLRNTGK